MQSMRTLKVFTYHCDAPGCTNSNTVTIADDQVDPRPSSWVEVNGPAGLDAANQGSITHHYCGADCFTNAVLAIAASDATLEKVQALAATLDGTLTPAIPPMVASDNHSEVAPAEAPAPDDATPDA